MTIDRKKIPGESLSAYVVDANGKLNSYAFGRPAGTPPGETILVMNPVTGEKLRQKCTPEQRVQRIISGFDNNTRGFDIN